MSSYVKFGYQDAKSQNNKENDHPACAPISFDRTRNSKCKGISAPKISTELEKRNHDQ